MIEREFQQQQNPCWTNPIFYIKQLYVSKDLYAYGQGSSFKTLDMGAFQNSDPMAQKPLASKFIKENWRDTRMIPLALKPSFFNDHEWQTLKVKGIQPQNQFQELKTVFITWVKTFTTILERSWTHCFDKKNPWFWPEIYKFSACMHAGFFHVWS